MTPEQFDSEIKNIKVTQAASLVRTGHLLDFALMDRLEDTRSSLTKALYVARMVQIDEVTGKEGLEPEEFNRRALRVRELFTEIESVILSGFVEEEPEKESNINPAKEEPA